MGRAKLILPAVGVALAVALVGCSQKPAVDEGRTNGESMEQGDSPQDGTTSVELAWLDTELTDAVTGEPFTMRDVADGPLLIQGFAVW